MKWRLLLATSVLGAVACYAKEADVEKYNNQVLGPWLHDVAVAVCELEVKHTTGAGLNPATRICPNGLGGGGDKTGVPGWPPP